MKRNRNDSENSSNSAGPSYKAPKPKKVTKMTKCGTFLYNKRTHAFCNRTCKSWALLLFFYLAFIAIMVGLFMLVLLGATNQLIGYDDLPYLKKKELLTNDPHHMVPGVSFIPSRVNMVTEPMVYFTTKKGGKDTIKNRKTIKYIKEIRNFFKERKQVCIDFNLKHHGNTSCTSDSTYFGPCSKGSYGYEEGNPCIFIKLNLLEDWSPGEYKHENELPRSMPSQIKKLIKKNMSYNAVYLYCQGHNTADADHILEISYYPHQWFDAKWFPYSPRNDPRINPLIAIQIKQQRGVLTYIECHIWAKNVAPKTFFTQVYLYIAI